MNIVESRLHPLELLVHIDYIQYMFNLEEHLLGEIRVSGAECLECFAFMRGKVENAAHQKNYVRLDPAHRLYYVWLDDAMENFMTSLPNLLMSCWFMKFEISTGGKRW